MTQTNDEVTDEAIEETQEEVNELEDNQGGEKTLEDYQNLEKENTKLKAQNKTLGVQRAKAIGKLNKSNEVNKQTSASPLSREESVLIAQGYTLKEVDLANEVATYNNLSLLEAVDHDYIKSVVSSRQQKERSDRAALSPSFGSSPVKADKPQGEMTTDEHQSHFQKTMANVR